MSSSHSFTTFLTRYARWVAFCPPLECKDTTWLSQPPFIFSLLLLSLSLRASFQNAQKQSHKIAYGTYDNDLRLEFHPRSRWTSLRRSSRSSSRPGYDKLSPLHSLDYHLTSNVPLLKKQDNVRTNTESVQRRGFISGEPLSRPNIPRSWLTLHWRHRTCDHLIPHTPFPIGVLL